MVKLRLTRIGKKHQPKYRLIAIQARTKREGEAIEYLGFYDPMTKPSTIEIKKDRVQYWLKVGAQPTETVSYLLAKEGVIKPIKKKYNSKPGRKTQERMKAAEAAKEAEKAAKEAAKAAEEKPAEEIKAEETAAVEASTEQAAS